VAGDTGTNTAAVTGVSASTGPLGVTGSSDVQSNLPLYIDFYACQKD
jgi:hypothetical protein